MKKFIKLIANADIITKNKKTDRINTKIASAVLNRQALKMIQQNINVYIVKKI